MGGGWWLLWVDAACWMLNWCLQSDGWWLDADATPVLRPIHVFKGDPTLRDQQDR